MSLPMWQESGFKTMLTNGLFVYEVATMLRPAEISDTPPDISQVIEDIVSGWERGEKVSMKELDEALDKTNSKEELATVIRTLVKQSLTLKQAALKDPLTKLDNRRALDEKLPAEMSRLRRQKPPGKLALFMIDADYFKRVNDTLGHEMGNVTLKGLARIIKSSLREYDIVARYGGEEFVVAAEADEENAIKIAENLRVAVEQNLKDWMKEKCKNEKERKLADSMAGTISIGISFYDAEKDNGKQMEDLIEEADVALYEAKKTRNTWVANKPDEERETGKKIA